ncbi:taste receptor type 2 member 8-like [Oncorhynchus tshawytscha]|uniref:taste receptor type 2 member 8-like n=1 Tax=Oncorhynchus tshawytscha TaxID=74940 RepID=UPI001C3C6378|nr:taste receptor type 2 member 8-like [Oncorhynchus tshawytscha]
MSSTYIVMDELAYIIVNGHLAILNILANLFFAFCLFCPPRGREGLKQPVKLLLGFLVFCTTIFLVFLITAECLWLLSESKESRYVDAFVSFAAFTSMSTSVWLNFFYYTQIVPAQRALFIWVKRNIKIIIYWSLFVDRVLFLFDLASVIYYVTITEGNDNITYTSTNDTVSGSTDGLFYTDLVCFYSKMIYMFFCLCVMVGSSWVTVCYLHRHMKSMKESGSPFSSPRLHSQMRVTITGILQGILYFLCALWIFLNIFSDNYPSSIKFDYNTYYTVISLYMFSTTVNLGIGQSVFRQRAADIWLKAQQAARSLKLCG